jgi:hypothetical protein
VRAAVTQIYELTQAAVRKARSPAEMSEGDRRRREAWREEQVRERKERELDGVTFSPRTGVTGHYSDVQSRLCLGRPDVYMEYLEHRTQTQVGAGSPSFFVPIAI